MGGVEFSAEDRAWIREEVSKHTKEEQKHWKSLREEEQQDYLKREKKVNRFTNAMITLYLISIIAITIIAMFTNVVWCFIGTILILLLPLAIINICEEYDYKVWKDYPNKRYTWI